MLAALVVFYGRFKLQCEGFIELYWDLLFNSGILSHFEEKLTSSLDDSLLQRFRTFEWSHNEQ